MSHVSPSSPQSLHFSHQTAAERYAHGRPRFHQILLPQIRAIIGERKKALAVDVACGTGNSTVALIELADRVIGTDISPEMLSQTPNLPNVSWLLSPAETLPFPDHSIDLVTVTMALHWIDRSRFLPEVRRILGSDGWMLVISNRFRAEMIGNPAFHEWCRNALYARFTTPPRYPDTFTDQEALAHGLRFVARETYTNPIMLSRDDLVVYFLTQSNFIARIEEGSETVESISAWLREELDPFFTNELETFMFGGWIWYLQRDVQRDVQRGGEWNAPEGTTSV